MNAAAPAPATSDVSHLGVYLSAYLAPFQHWLSDENVTEILVNAAGRGVDRERRRRRNDAA